MEIKDKLLDLATEFTIDQFIDLNLSKRTESKWTLISSRECLGKDGEFIFEPSPSNRTEEFLNSTRFDSIEDAVEFYLNWRSKRYFLIARCSGDYKWHCFCISTSQEQCDKTFDALGSKGKVLLIGKNREIIREFKGEHSSTEEFKDLL